MRPYLYLDTARLGRMSPAAQAAQIAFTRMSGEVGAVIHLESFLKFGAEETIPSLLSDFPGIESWRGLAELSQQLARLAGLQGRRSVFLAARSAELMKLAAYCLCRPCRNVLTCDLAWPPYREVLASVCARLGRKLTIVPLAQAVLTNCFSESDVLDRLAAAFSEQRCDGLFLPAVSNLGVQLPVTRLVELLGPQCRFVAVDGSQDFCHTGGSVSGSAFDIYLTGAHKWLGAGNPLGIGMFGLRRSRQLIATVLRDRLASGDIDDPLLRYLTGVSECRTSPIGETVNLLPLMTARAAAQDAGRPSQLRELYRVRQQNAAALHSLARETGWHVTGSSTTAPTGIVTLRSTARRSLDRPPPTTRRLAAQHGLILSSFRGGLLRLSLPSTPLTGDETTQVSEVLRVLGQ